MIHRCLCYRVFINCLSILDFVFLVFFVVYLQFDPRSTFIRLDNGVGNGLGL
jgi:hypothetical protein